MSEDAQPLLVNYLTKHYANLKLRLARLLGNDDLAGDALQDTWLRLQNKDAEGVSIQSPGAYLIRMAANIAVDIQRKHGRSLSHADISELLLEVRDPAPGPAQTAEGQSELEALTGLLARLPQRQRELIILVRWEGLTQKDAAQRLGVSLRTVEYDLKNAHEYLDARMTDAKE